MTVLYRFHCISIPFPSLPSLSLPLPRELHFNHSACLLSNLFFYPFCSHFPLLHSSSHSNAPTLFHPPFSLILPSIPYLSLPPPPHLLPSFHLSPSPPHLPFSQCADPYAAVVGGTSETLECSVDTDGDGIPDIEVQVLLVHLSESMMIVTVPHFF